MHGDCTHDHENNENNERNEEGRDCGSLGHCEVVLETPQDRSWMHGDVLRPSSRSSSPRRLNDDF